MIDIVIPNNNEEEFIVMAEKLGYTGLCFLYDSNDYMNKQFENKKIKIEIGVLGDNKNIDKIKGKNEKVFVAVKSSNNDKEIMERSKETLEQRVKSIRIRRAGKPIDVAKVIYELAFNNDYISGSNITIDGADFI